MNVDVEKIVRDNIDSIIHLSLATASNNQPWVCEVHFGYDNDLNLYFRSKPSRRHCVELRSNPNVAGNIIKQFHPGDSVVGVYFDGIAEQLEDVNEQSPAYIVLSNKQSIGQSALDEQFKEDGHKFYKISVKNWHVFGRFGGDHGQKYSLSWN